MENNKFTVVIDNNKYDAYVISNFSMLGDNYCMYAVDNGKEDKDVYCDKVIDNTLVKIESSEELQLISKIVKSILDAVKGRNLNG